MKNKDYRGFYRVWYITLLNNEKSLYIAEIRASKLGCGYGSSMLNEILDQVDKEHISVCLHANSSLYEKGLNQHDLEDWYFRHGFNHNLDLDPLRGTNFFYREKQS